MSLKKCLGIHYTNSQITAVLTEKVGTDFRLEPTLRISSDNTTVPGLNLLHQESENPAPGNQSDASVDPEQSCLLIDKISRTIHNTYTRVSPISLALGGSFYQSQSHHSQFTQTQQIDETLRYDIEEDFAIDSDNIALCYKKKASPENDLEDGSDLLVFTSDRKILTDILNRFEQADLDALTTEPDCVSWLHFLQSRNVCSKLSAEQSLIAAGWTSENLYILVLDASGQPVLARSLLCSGAAQALDLLSGEIARTRATLPAGQQPRLLLYHPVDLDANEMNKIAQHNKLKPLPLPDIDMAGACAAGAAIGWLNHQNTTTDFRKDNLQAKTLVTGRKHALLGLGTVISLLMLTWILIMSMHSRNFHQMQNEAEKDLINAWKLAFPGKSTAKLDPRKIPGDIRGRLKEVKQKYGAYDVNSQPDTASNTLRLLFQALNQAEEKGVLPEAFDLQIKNISVDGDSATLDGSVPDMVSLEMLQKAFETPDTQLEISSLSIRDAGSDSQRRNFNMPMKVIKKSTPPDQKRRN
ncbi:MAG: hypothetical protein JW860_10675 [Sedimentisphaerales bacterium]|nr:hypothetical protein [Sedimentisphaerales bacterium]